MNFKNIRGEDISISDIAKLISKDYDYTEYVGTDSQVHRDKKSVLYATCIVLYRKGKGGTMYISKNFEPHISSLRQRLTKEVWKSLDTSFNLLKFLPKNTEIVVHIDSNKSRKHKSGNYTEELVGMVVGQGFKYKIKPDAWAAQSVADRFSK